MWRGGYQVRAPECDRAVGMAFGECDRAPPRQGWSLAGAARRDGTHGRGKAPRPCGFRGECRRGGRESEWRLCGKGLSSTWARGQLACQLQRRCRRRVEPAPPNQAWDPGRRRFPQLAGGAAASGCLAGPGGKRVRRPPVAKWRHSAVRRRKTYPAGGAAQGMPSRRWGSCGRGGRRRPGSRARACLLGVALRFGATGAAGKDARASGCTGRAGAAVIGAGASGWEHACRGGATRPYGYDAVLSG